jgi:hypothetical protein
MRIRVECYLKEIVLSKVGQFRSHSAGDMNVIKLKRLQLNTSNSSH